MQIMLKACTAQLQNTQMSGLAYRGKELAVFARKTLAVCPVHSARSLFAWRRWRRAKNATGASNATATILNLGHTTVI
eukprot:SAG22_NODE_20109_length_268_cov_0.923077_1_plen_77_part_10